MTLLSRRMEEKTLIICNARERGREGGRQVRDKGRKEGREGGGKDGMVRKRGVDGIKLREGGRKEGGKNKGRKEGRREEQREEGSKEWRDKGKEQESTHRRCMCTI